MYLIGTGRWRAALATCTSTSSAHLLRRSGLVSLDPSGSILSGVAAELPQKSTLAGLKDSG